MKGPTGNTTQKRLRILRDDEIDALYGRPRFTPEEREEYFALSWGMATIRDKLGH